MDNPNGKDYVAGQKQCAVARIFCRIEDSPIYRWLYPISEKSTTQLYLAPFLVLKKTLVYSGLYPNLEKSSFQLYLTALPRFCESPVYSSPYPQLEEFTSELYLATFISFKNTTPSSP